jgi:hypothetical protein
MKLNFYKYKNSIRKMNLDINNLQKQYIVKGHVQSGKTNFIINTSKIFLDLNYLIVIIVRDRKSDKEQLFNRLKIQIKKYSDVYIILGNASSISKIEKKLDKPYILFIDEVDFVDHNQKSQKYKSIQILKEKAVSIFGISATIMDSLAKDNILSENLILLDTSTFYKGIQNIEMIEIDENSKFTGKIKSNLFDQDINLFLFINSFISRKPYKEHPNICLITNSRTKHPCEKAQIELSKHYSNLSIIIYNGNGISFTKGEVSFKSKKSISSFLQVLKNEGLEIHPHIIIFAGDLAGRSISFTSEDYQWHLTDQRLLVSNTCDEPELIQKIRLCGIYKDDIPLRLYSTKKIILDLKKAFFRQEEIISSLKDTEMKSLDFINSMEMNTKKLTHRNMVKDQYIQFEFKKVNKETGWSMDLYETKVKLKVEPKLEPNLVEPNLVEPKLEPNVEPNFECKVECKVESNVECKVDLIIDKIRKHLSTNKTFISKFLLSIDPTIFYKKDDLLDILKKAGYQQPKNYIKSLLGSTKYGFGHSIFENENDLYKIKKNLSICWNKI